MSVKLRMTRIGRRHRPFFRINAIDTRNPRDGKIIEKIGQYDPIEKDPEKQLIIDTEKAKMWLDKGAIPSDTVSELLVKAGIPNKHFDEKKKRRARAKAIARKKGVYFTQAEKIAAEKAAEEAAAKAAAEAEAKAKAEEEAKKAEEEAAKKAEEEAKAAEENKEEGGE